MGLLDDMIEPEGRIYNCRVRTVKDTLEPADQIKFEQLVNDLTWPANTLAKGLASKGLHVSQQIITRHRRGECTCSKI